MFNRKYVCGILLSIVFAIDKTLWILHNKIKNSMISLEGHIKQWWIGGGEKQWDQRSKFVWLFFKGHHWAIKPLGRLCHICLFANVFNKNSFLFF